MLTGICCIGYTQTSVIAAESLDRICRYPQKHLTIIFRSTIWHVNISL